MDFIPADAPVTHPQVVPFRERVVERNDAGDAGLILVLPGARVGPERVVPVPLLEGRISLLGPAGADRRWQVVLVPVVEALDHFRFGARSPELHFPGLE